MLTASSAPKSAPTTLFKTFSLKLHAWMRYREAVKELSQLSDRELGDIGLNRGIIEHAARGDRD